MSRRAKKKQILKLAEEVCYKRDIGEPYEGAMRKFQEKVPYPNVEELFFSDKGPEYIAKRAMNYKNIKPGDLSRDELIELVKKIINNPGVSEHQADLWIQILEDAVVDPEITNYIFWEDGLTPEEIVDKALSYKPIVL
ncbi:e9imm peptide [Priestia abyssalis]|uniref:e9imm peptide n=1 Tax=Priestia abyssalis TaxID=1221450 RepID=UPI001F43A7A7|nr:e9imm peptide [Priestia abyssalis]